MATGGEGRRGPSVHELQVPPPFPMQGWVGPIWPHSALFFGPRVGPDGKATEPGPKSTGHTTAHHCSRLPSPRSQRHSFARPLRLLAAPSSLSPPVSPLLRRAGGPYSLPGHALCERVAASDNVQPPNRGQGSDCNPGPGAMPALVDIAMEVLCMGVIIVIHRGCRAPCGPAHPGSASCPSLAGSVTVPAACHSSEHGQFSWRLMRHVHPGCRRWHAVSVLGSYVGAQAASAVVCPSSPLERVGRDGVWELRGRPKARGLLAERRAWCSYHGMPCVPHGVYEELGAEFRQSITYKFAFWRLSVERFTPLSGQP